MTNKPRVLLIDLSAFFHPAWRASEHEPISTAYESTIGGVKRACDMFPDALVAICCDGKGNWRKAISTEYKAKRDKLPDVFYEQFRKVKERLRADGRLLWEFEGFEADDVIATAKTEAFSRGHEVTIATHDKDLFQLVTKAGCDVLSLGSWEIRTEADVIAKFGVEPAQIADFLALTGDASDNVPGCPSCGPVTAAKLLKAWPELAPILDQPEAEIAKVAGKSLASKLVANKAQIELSRRLVELKRDVPLNFDEIYEKREVMPLLPQDPESEPNSAEPATEEAGEPSPPTEGSSVSLVRAEPAPALVEYERGLEPRSFKEAIIMARHLYESRLYQRYGTPDAIAAIIVRGRELGLGALTALDVFHVVEGKPYPFAYLIVAMCRRHPDCDYLLPVEQDDKHAIAETKHRKFDKPIRLEFTFEQAKTAQLPKTGARGPNGWFKNPEDMLVKTALAKLGRRIYSEAALGLTSLEELGEA